MTINSFTGHGLLVLPVVEEREGMTPASHPPNLRVRGDEVGLANRCGMEGVKVVNHVSPNHHKKQVLRVEEDADEDEVLKLVTESLTPKQDAAAATPVGEKRGLAQQQQPQQPKRRAPPAPLKKGLAKGQVPAGQTVTLATVQEVSAWGVCTKRDDRMVSVGLPAMSCNTGHQAVRKGPVGLRGRRALPRTGRRHPEAGPGNVHTSHCLPSFIWVGDI